jgi:hypothetical protein
MNFINSIKTNISQEPYKAPTEIKQEKTTIEQIKKNEPKQKQEIQKNNITKELKPIILLLENLKENNTTKELQINEIITKLNNLNI